MKQIKILLLAISILISIGLSQALLENMSNNPADYVLFDDGGDIQTLDGSAVLPANATLLTSRGWTGQNYLYTEECAYQGSRGINLFTTTDTEVRKTLDTPLAQGCIYFSHKARSWTNLISYGVNFRDTNVGSDGRMKFSGDGNLYFGWLGSFDYLGTFDINIWENFTLCLNATHFAVYRGNESNYMRSDNNIWSEEIYDLKISADQSGAGQGYDSASCIDNVRVWSGGINDYPKIASPPELTADWESYAPANNSLINSLTTIFNFNLSHTSTANCSLYTNESGSFQINQTMVDIPAGENSFNYTIGLNVQENRLFYVLCNNDTQSSQTSVKDMQIDTKSVYVNVNYPADASVFYEDEISSINLNISYRNAILDYAYYELRMPNTTIVKSNSPELSQQYFTFYEPYTLPADRLGIWSIYAFGNDSAGNSKNTTTTFNVMQRPVYLEDTKPVQALLESSGTGMAILIDKISLPTGKFLIIIAVIFGIAGVIASIIFRLRKGLV